MNNNIVSGRKKLMRVLFGIWFVIIIQSCNETSPISGIYQANDKTLSAVILDSTLHLIINEEEVFIYELSHYKTYNFDTITFSLYNVNYLNAINKSGYEFIKLPIKFEYDQEFGGALNLSFTNYDNFKLGGYKFHRQKNESAISIFKTWENLYYNNTQTRLLLEYDE